MYVEITPNSRPSPCVLRHRPSHPLEPLDRQTNKQTIEGKKRKKKPHRRLQPRETHQPLTAQEDSALPLSVSPAARRGSLPSSCFSWLSPSHGGCCVVGLECGMPLRQQQATSTLRTRHPPLLHGSSATRRPFYRPCDHPAESLVLTAALLRACSTTNTTITPPLSIPWTCDFSLFLFSLFLFPCSTIFLICEPNLLLPSPLLQFSPLSSLKLRSPPSPQASIFFPSSLSNTST